MDEFVLIPGTGGAFELFVNGEKIHSKQETGQYPDEQEIVRRLKGA